MVAVAQDRGGGLVLHLDDRPLGHEEPGQVDGLGEAAAAVGTQVDDEAVDLLVGEIVQDPERVVPGAVVLLVAAADGREVDVERRQVDHADLLRRAIGILRLDHTALRPGFVHRHLAAHDGDLLGGGLRALTGRQDGQRHARAFLAPEQRHDLRQRHIHHVDGLAALLRHADDAVVLAERALLVGRAVLHDLDDLRVAVLGRQHGADAGEVQGDVNVEILAGGRGHVGGVGVIDVRERGQVSLQHVDRVHPGDGGAELVDTLLDALFRSQQRGSGRRRFLLFLRFVLVAGSVVLLRLGGFLRVLLGGAVAHAGHDEFVFQAFRPDVMLFGDVFRPRGVLAVQAERLLGVVFDRLGEEIAGEVAVFGHPQRTRIEDVERELDVSGGGVARQIVLLLRELVHVRLQEENVRGVQVAQVFVEDLAGIRRVHRAACIMLLRQQLNHEGGDQAHPPVRALQRDRGRRGFRRRCGPLPRRRFLGVDGHGGTDDEYGGRRDDGKENRESDGIVQTFHKRSDSWINRRSCCGSREKNILIR